MWTLTDHSRSSGGRISRRQWLGVSAAGGFALAGGNAFGRETGGPSSSVQLSSEPGFGQAKTVILVFANGGQSHLEMWDPKPAAPREVRGEFQAIDTAIPGLQFGEHLPRIARVADRLTVIRSMSHEDIDHGSAVYLALTGSYHPQRSGNPPPAPTDMPTYGAVLRRVRQGVPSAHDAIHLNAPALLPVIPGPGQDAGLLGRRHDPLVVGDVMHATGALPGLALRVDLPLDRLSERLSLLRSIESRSIDRRPEPPGDNPEAARVDQSYSAAFEMLASPTAREAFDLTGESTATRDRYGRHRSGQALLLARRLAEAGVPFINVIWNQSNRGQDDDPASTDAYGWDTHNDIFVALRERLLPRFDESFSALIEDLDQRGLLDQTLVVCMGEFGRAPLVALEKNFAGATPGRKHWATVYSIVMAGSGVQRGAVVGASDRLGGEPASERYGPWDVAATMFHALGIAPEQHYTDPLGRPFPVSHGRPIRAVYGGA